MAQCLTRSHCLVETFGLRAGDWRASEIRCEGETTDFAVHRREKPLGRLRMKLSGEHNVMNVLAAAALAWRYDISWEKISAAVETFRGVRRRMGNSRGGERGSNSR